MVADADCSRGLFTVYQKKAKNKLLVGYIIDEAAHHKNGKKSVGA